MVLQVVSTTYGHDTFEEVAYVENDHDCVLVM
jgi:hypothetical protein